MWETQKHRRAAVLSIFNGNFNNVQVAQDIAGNMAWERRGNKRYYYRSVRVGGKVKKTYFGNGPLAIAAAEEMEVARLERERGEETRRMQRERYQQMDGVMGELADELDRLLAAELMVTD